MCGCRSIRLHIIYKRKATALTFLCHPVLPSSLSSPHLPHKFTVMLLSFSLVLTLSAAHSHAIPYREPYALKNPFAIDHGVTGNGNGAPMESQPYIAEDINSENSIAHNNGEEMTIASSDLLLNPIPLSSESVKVEVASTFPSDGKYVPKNVQSDLNSKAPNTAPKPEIERCFLTSRTPTCCTDKGDRTGNYQDCVPCMGMSRSHNTSFR